MDAQEKGCAEAIAEVITGLPLSMQKLVKVYAEGVADAKAAMDE